MPRLLINYTLLPPKQDYNAVFDVVFSVSTRYAHVDASEFVVDTPYTSAMVEVFLKGAIDGNDRYLVGQFMPERTNVPLEWQIGAQGSAQAKLQVGPFLRAWRDRAMQLRRGVRAST